MLDIEDAGAALLGLDVARAHACESVDPVRALLVEARDPESRLVADVIAAGSSTDSEFRDRMRLETSRRFAAAFEAGLTR